MRGSQTTESRARISSGLKSAYANGTRKPAFGMSGKKHSPETLEKMRIAARERVARIGKPTHGYQQGHSPSDAVKQKMRGPRPQVQGEGSHRWQGDQVGYGGLHIWIRKMRGTPSMCEFCGTTTAKRYEWANKSGEYKRELSDWLRLCKKCHYHYDDIAGKSAATRAQKRSQ